MNGWIKLHRKLIEWEWYKDSNTLHLFIHLLLTANHEPQKWRGITIERGQVLTGRKELSFATGISEQSLRTSINRLKSTSELTIKPTNKYSIITICNYDSYQSEKSQPNQLSNQQPNQRLTNNQPTTNHKQEGEEHKERKEGEEGAANCNFVTKRNNPPTLSEVIEFFKSYGYAESGAIKFFNHYDLSGWKDPGGNNMIPFWKITANQKWFQTSEKFVPYSNVRKNTLR